MSQQPFTPTDADRELVAILAGNGIPFEIIARCIKHAGTGEPIARVTLKKYFREQLKDGRAIADAKLIGRAYAMAMENASVLIFMCKTRLGWKEPAQEVNLRQSYEDLVKKADEQPKPAGAPELKLVNGGQS